MGATVSRILANDDFLGKQIWNLQQQMAGPVGKPEKEKGEI